MPPKKQKRSRQSVIDDEVEETDLQTVMKTMASQMRSMTEVLRSLMTEKSDRGGASRVTTGDPTPNANTSGSTPIVNMGLTMDMARDLKKYDGTGGAISAREWLADWRSLNRIYGWPDATAVEVAKRAFSGAAESWFRLRRTRFDNVETFIAMFKSTFCRDKGHADRVMHMVNRIQQSNETAIAYTFEKLRLCDGLEMEVPEIKLQLTRGLRSVNLAQLLLGRDFDMEDDLINAVREHEEEFCESRARREFRKVESKAPENRSKNTSDIIKRNAAPAVDEKPKEKTETPNWRKRDENTAAGVTDQRSVKSGVRCFNCGQNGHYSRTCIAPKRPKKCTSCGDTSHYRSECPNLDAKEDIRPAVNMARTEKLTTKLRDGLYSKDVKIEGVVAGSFVDTGATPCLIRDSCAVKIFGEDLQPSNRLLSGLNNVEVRAHAQRFAPVEIDGVVVNCTLYVVNDDAIPVDVVIGRTWLDHPQVAFVKMLGSLRIREVEENNIDPAVLTFFWF